ncbi:MAG: flagellar motor switch protein FliM [Solirubrobacteraceae bacterium]
MNDVLSADEIAQLFAAAKDGKLPEGPRTPARRARSIRKINFSRPMKLSLLEQRRFEQAHATFCRDASVRLSSELRSSIELEVINSSQLTWEAAVGDVPQPSILGVAACAPGESTILICVEEGLVLRMVERLLGGSYTDTPVPRTLTQIDVALARGLFEGLLSALSTVWQGLLGLSLSLLEFESHSTGLDLMPRSQPTLELTIEVRDQGASSTILLLVPYTAIEAASKSLGDSSPKDADALAAGEESCEAVRSALGAVRVEVRAEAGAVGLTIGEVLSLGEGDVIRLGVAGEADITVGDNRLHRVRPGLSGNRRAVQIIEPVGGGA